MSYLAGRTAKKAVEDSVIESLQGRDAKMCET